MSEVEPSTHRSGFTLIEMMVAIGIIALIIGAAVVAIGSLTGSEAKKATGELAGTIRAMYDVAALKGKTCRLVFALPGRQQDGEVKYSAECASGNVTTSRDRDAVVDEENQNDAELARRSGGSSPSLQESLADEESRVDNASRFSTFEDETIPPRAFPESVSVTVWTQHQREAIEEGNAFLYFFPQGFTEKSMVVVRQGDNAWTIVVSPLTGKTTIEYGAKETPRS